MSLHDLMVIIVRFRAGVCPRCAAAPLQACHLLTLTMGATTRGDVSCCDAMQARSTVPPGRRWLDYSNWRRLTHPVHYTPGAVPPLSMTLLRFGDSDVCHRICGRPNSINELLFEMLHCFISCTPPLLSARLLASCSAIEHLRHLCCSRHAFAQPNLTVMCVRTTQSEAAFVAGLVDFSTFLHTQPAINAIRARSTSAAAAVCAMRLSEGAIV